MTTSGRGPDDRAALDPAEEERYRRAAWTFLVDGTDQVVLLDEAGSILWASRWGADWLGYDTARLVGRSFIDFIHPEEVAGALNVMLRAADPERPDQVQAASYRVKHADGTYREVWVNGVYAAEERLFVVHGRRATDTEVFDAIMELVTVGAPTDEIFARIPDFGRWRMPDGHHGVFYLSDDGRPQRVGSDLLDGLGPVDDRESPAAAVAASPSGLACPATELPDGARSRAEALGIVYLAGMHVLDPLHDRPCVAISALTDDARAPVANYVLQRMVRAIRLVLRSRDQMVRLRAAVTELERFLADASHELRTPLTSIIGYTDLVEAGALGAPEGLEHAMSRIRGESERLLALVEDLLLLARLGQRRPLRSDPVDVAAVVREVAADAGAADPDRRISVTATAPALTVGDEDRIRQVVTNLVANARAHTPATTPIDLTVTVDDQEVRAVVADHGEGLDSAAAERVFERFWRSGGTEPDAPAGSGLGLPIAAAIAEALGGRVTLETTPGAGCRFTLHLPVLSARSS